MNCIIETKNSPTPSKRNIVIFLLIEIFLKEYVGNFEIKSNDTIIVKYGVITFKLIKFEKLDKSNIKGNNIKHPPAGYGIP